MSKQFLDKEGLQVAVNNVKEAKETAAGAMALAQQAIDNVGPTNYSTAEQFTGKYWIDGKKIYCKVVDFGALPNADTKTVVHNISNVDTFIYVNGVAKKSDHTAIPVNYINPTAINNSIGLYVDSINITIITTNDLRDYANTYVFLEYTKTTD